jgi:hypothetical protein
MLKKDENNVAKFIEENEQNMNNAIDSDINLFETEDNIDIDDTNINDTNTNDTNSYTNNSTDNNESNINYQKVYSYDEIKDNINDPRLKKRLKDKYKKKDTKNNTIYAGFWIRFFAFLFDSMLVNCIMYFVDKTFFYNYHKIAYVLVFCVYNVLFTMIFGSTFGKALFGIKVMSEKQDKISFSSIIIREFFGKIVLMYLKFLFVFVAFSNKKHSIIDYFADTCVIKTKYELEFKNYK